MELKEYTPAIRIKAGELVCDAVYYNKVAGARGWYTPTQGEDAKTVVRVQQVVAANLTLAPISATNALPSGMSKTNKKKATAIHAVKLVAQEHQEILEEINRREATAHDDVDEDALDDEEDDEDDEHEEGNAASEDGEE